MNLKAGQGVSYRITSEYERHNATIVSVGPDVAVLSMHREKEEDLPVGKHIIVSGGSGDYYFEVTAAKGDDVHVKRIEKEKREYFRVDDVFPVNFTKVKRDGRRPQKAKVCFGTGDGTTGIDVPEDMT